jgi:hypothetical protein
MTSTTGERQDVREYLEALKAHLGDIPPDERQDVLDDLEAHLAEVAAESDEPLASRLGSPEAYATELRASAGYGPPAPPAPESGRRAGDAWRAVVAHPWVQAARAFMPELRPGWWVLRGVAAVLVPFAIWTHGHDNGHRLPPGVGLPMLLAATLAAVVLSVRLGRHAAAGRHVILSVLVSVAVVIAMAAALGQARDRFGGQVVYVDNGQGQGSQQMVDQNGRPIFNIYPFAADGTPLDNVLLYDQDGQPLDNLSTQTPDGRPVVSQSKVANSYPRQLLIPDGNDPSAMRPDQRPTVVIPRVVESTTTTTTAPPAQGAPAP